MPRGRRSSFLLCWMWIPVIMILLISFAIVPMWEERYVLSSFVAFFILIALGICSLESANLRLAALAVVAAMSLFQLRSDRLAERSKPGFPQWREAASIALSASKPGDRVAVLPEGAVYVVRYYSPPARRADEIAAPLSGGVGEVEGVEGAGVLVFNHAALRMAGGTEEQVQSIRSEYPRVLGRVRDIDILAK